MFEEILKDFTSSSHGQGALAALAQNGFSPEQAQNLINGALPAAAASFTQQTAGSAHPHIGLFNLFGGHAAKDFFAGLVAGVVRGDGISGSLKDGAVGVLVGHLTEYFADSAGMDGATAGAVAAAVAPFIAGFVHQEIAARL